VIAGHWRSRKNAPHLLWWTLGVFFFGLGTLCESLTTLLGWDEFIFRFWYIVGALLGGAPLAQGTVYLLLERRTANILAFAVVVISFLGSVAVLTVPINYEMVESYRLTGKVFAEGWVRLFSPFLNIYAFIFLVGGALWSAFQYRKREGSRHRFLGNLFIAIGALLPGIGGTFTRMGYTEVLYVTEFVGISVIFIGYLIIRREWQEFIPV